MKFRGVALNSTDETGTGLIRATIRFLTENPPKNWVFPSIQPRLDETSMERALL